MVRVYGVFFFFPRQREQRGVVRGDGRLWNPRTRLPEGRKESVRYLLRYMLIFIVIFLKLWL